MRRLVAEAIGTFILVFAGTGAIIVNDVSHGAVTHVGISLTFGLVVMSMIYALGDLSGAHLNPAVTLGFWRARRFPAAGVIGYIAAQCLGAIVASAVLRLLFPENATLGATLPAGTLMQAFAFEFLLTAILMFVILNVSTGAKEKGIMAGTSIGAVIAFEALVGGPISGASMNPARSLGPAFISGRLSELWIYLVAPILGAMTAVVGCRCVQAEGCCVGTCQPGEFT
jgi:aquaporin NIP